MAGLNVKKGDSVLIISGKDKGKKGSVIKVDTEKGRVYVEGDKGIRHNLKHIKPRKAQDKGGRIEQPASVDSSNVMILCATCGEATRIGHKITTENGKEVKIRICKKCGASLEIAAKAKKETKKAATRKKKTDKVKEEKVEEVVKVEEVNESTAEAVEKSE